MGRRLEPIARVDEPPISIRNGCIYMPNLIKRLDTGKDTIIGGKRRRAKRRKRTQKRQ